MLKAKIVNKIKFPAFNFQRELDHIGGKIIVPDIVNGIDRQVAITGGRLPKNELITLKRKSGTKALINTGKLRRAIRHKTIGKSKVLITIRGQRKKIGGFLQIDGVKLKSGKIKFYEFFGISKDAARLSMRFMENRIKGLLRG